MATCHLSFLRCQIANRFSTFNSNYLLFIKLLLALLKVLLLRSRPIMYKEE